MNRHTIILLLLLCSMYSNAQFLKQKSVDVTIGLGLSAPYEDIDISGSGFYLQGEYVLEHSKWLDIRPYIGLILTKAGDEDFDGNPTIYQSETNALLIGGKIRFTIPIPYVAPFIEGGIGASVGSFRTFTPLHDIDDKGFTLHFPFTLGLEIGRNHNFDIAVIYYFQPDVEQFVGAVGIGFSIPLNKGIKN